MEMRRLTRCRLHMCRRRLHICRRLRRAAYADVERRHSDGRQGLSVGELEIAPCDIALSSSILRYCVSPNIQGSELIHVNAVACSSFSLLWPLISTLKLLTDLHSAADSTTANLQQQRQPNLSSRSPRSHAFHVVGYRSRGQSLQISRLRLYAYHCVAYPPFDCGKAIWGNLWRMARSRKHNLCPSEMMQLFIVKQKWSNCR